MSILTYFDLINCLSPVRKIQKIKSIENNPNLTARILSALKVGSVKALEQFLNHPAANFVIGALEDWEKTKGVD